MLLSRLPHTLPPTLPSPYHTSPCYQNRPLWPILLCLLCSLPLAHNWTPILLHDRYHKVVESFFFFFYVIVPAFKIFKEFASDVGAFWHVGGKGGREGGAKVEFSLQVHSTNMFTSFHNSVACSVILDTAIYFYLLKNDLNSLKRTPIIYGIQQVNNIYNLP